MGIQRLPVAKLLSRQKALQCIFHLSNGLFTLWITEMTGMPHQDAGGRAGGGCNFYENGECGDGESAQTCFWEQMSMQALVLRGGEQNLFLYPALKQAVLKAKRGLMPQHGREKDAYCLVEVPLRYRE